MIKMPTLKRTPAAEPAAALPSAPPRRSKREIIYSQLRNTTRRLVHPFVMALGWPSAATVYYRRRLLEATVIGLLLTEMVFIAMLLLAWLAPPPPLVVSLGADEISVVQNASPTSALPAVAASPTTILTPIATATAAPTATPTPHPTPSPTPGSYASGTPYDPGFYLPLPHTTCNHGSLAL
jgi:hypothetical protein